MEGEVKKIKKEKTKLVVTLKWGKQKIVKLWEKKNRTNNPFW
jgi:hypothetical protein